MMKLARVPSSVLLLARMPQKIIHFKVVRMRLLFCSSIVRRSMVIGSDSFSPLHMRGYAWKMRKLFFHLLRLLPLENDLSISSICITAAEAAAQPASNFKAKLASHDIA